MFHAGEGDTFKNVYGKGKELEYPQQFCQEKNKMEGASLPTFKTHFIATVIKITWY